MVKRADSSTNAERTATKSPFSLVVDHSLTIIPESGNKFAIEKPCKPYDNEVQWKTNTEKPDDHKQRERDGNNNRTDADDDGTEDSDGKHYLK